MSEEVKNMTTQEIKDTINRIESGRLIVCVDDDSTAEEDIEARKKLINELENELEMRTKMSKEMNITPLTIYELHKILDHISKNETYLAVMGNISIYYKGVTEDTAKGKRQMFYIERKID